MVSIREHGGACCGVRHIYGFDNSTRQDFEALVQRVENMDNVGSDRAFRMIEVILSDRQVDKFPWLAERGFRLVSRFENANSGRFCNVFHYHPHFLPLDNGAAAQWTGARHSTGGTATPAPAAAPVDDRIGQRVRYTRNGHDQVRLNDLGTIVAHMPGGGYRVRWDNGYTSRMGHEPRYLEHVVNEPAVPTVVARFWQNVFANGRRGGMYPLIGAAREAAPRCRRIDRVEIMSDGTRNVVENVND